LSWWTQHLFTIAALVLLYLAVFYGDPSKFVRTFFVIATAALAYYAKCSGLGELNMFGMEHVPIVRYLDWILTTPIMLSELCHIGHAADETYDMVIGCDLLMLSCGIASALIPASSKSTEKNIFFFAGSIFFAIMVFVLHRDVANGTAQHLSPPIQALFQNLSILTISAWSVYPLVCGLGRAHLGVISVPAEDTLICVLDMVSKIGMEAFIIYSVLTNSAAVNAEMLSTAMNITATALNMTAT
jgi:bacteriorhodopsin